jgi:hypothetical protein
MSARRVSSGFRPECRLGELEILKGASIGKHPASPLVPWADSPPVRSDPPAGETAPRMERATQPYPSSGRPRFHGVNGP